MIYRWVSGTFCEPLLSQISMTAAELLDSDTGSPSTNDTIKEGQGKAMVSATRQPIIRGYLDKGGLEYEE